jgi:hypothetical protein
MKRLLIFLAGFVTCITPSVAQFIVLSSSPSDRAVNVPRSTTVSFTFSEPLDTTARFDAGDRNLPISANPNDSITIGTIGYSTDLRTITFQVVHTGDSDFVWVIIGARSKNGNMLARPFMLNYTTATSYGSRSISGTVTVDGGNTTNVIVGLADAPLVGEHEGMVRSAMIVSNPSGAYSFSNIRDGVYWPAAVKDGDGNGSIDPGLGDPYGQYDPDGDGHADSIVISGSDRSGINIVLRSISSVPDDRSSMRYLKSPPQVCPNPLSARTAFRFSLQAPAHVRLCIYNRLGDQVGCLLDETCIGPQAVPFDASNIPDGIYFYRMMLGSECLSGELAVCR